MVVVMEVERVVERAVVMEVETVVEKVEGMEAVGVAERVVEDDERAEYANAACEGDEDGESVACEGDEDGESVACEGDGDGESVVSEGDGDGESAAEDRNHCSFLPHILDSHHSIPKSLPRSGKDSLANGYEASAYAASADGACVENACAESEGGAGDGRAGCDHEARGRAGCDHEARGRAASANDHSDKLRRHSRPVDSVHDNEMANGCVNANADCGRVGCDRVLHPTTNDRDRAR